MATCINHPEIEAQYMCFKHNTPLCEKCLVCRDPDLYCKFRSACPIHFLSKKGFDETEEPSSGRKEKIHETVGADADLLPTVK